MFTDLLKSTEFIRPDPDDDVLTMAFVNIQPTPAMYGLEEGYLRGTVFPALDKPFSAGGMLK